MSFSPMKLKAVVLTAGLIAFGANAAWSVNPTQKSTCQPPEKNYKVRNKGDHCTSKDYKYNSNKSCTCPGYPSNATKKCHYPVVKGGIYVEYYYSCEVP